MKIEKQQGLIKSRKQKAQDVVITAVAILISITCLLPMVNLLARSLSSSQALVRHEVYLWPVGTSDSDVYASGPDNDNALCVSADL